MAASKQDELSLLTEHFQYTPLDEPQRRRDPNELILTRANLWQTLIDDIINTVNELVYRAVTAVETGLNNTPATALGFRKSDGTDNTPDTSILSQSEYDENGESNFPEKRAEIENGVHKLETLLESSVDRNFDKFEIYLLRNILSVKAGLEKWVVLDHHQDLDFSQQPTITADELLMLRKKLNATKKLNASLIAEKEQNAIILGQLRALLEPHPPPSVADFKNVGVQSAEADDTSLAFLSHSEALEKLQRQDQSSRTQKGASGPRPSRILTTETKQVLQKLPQLRSKLAALREALAKGIKIPPATNGSSHEEERRAYLEGAVRSGLGDAPSWEDRPGSAKAQTRGIATAQGDVGSIEGIAAGIASHQQEDRASGTHDTPMG